MDAAAAQKLNRTLSDMSQSLKQLVRVLEANNENLVAISKQIKNQFEAPDVDLDDLVARVKRLRDLTSDRPAFQVGMSLRINDPSLIHHNRVGTISRIESHSMYVEFPGVEGEASFAPDEVEIVGQRETAKDYVLDDQGRMKPYEWRHNLGMNPVLVLPGQDPSGHENEPMTEEAFHIYNAGLDNQVKPIKED